MWRETTKQERNRRIFEEELDAFLPQRILDFHVHVFPESVHPDAGTFSCGGHPLSRYDLNDLKQDLAEVYPGRETAAVCFGIPLPLYDQAGHNAYLRDACDNQRFFALRLFDPLNDRPEDLWADLRTGRFVGIKPYPDYVRKPDLNLVEIPEMVPDWCMEIANTMGLAVTLHIPRRQRLADPLNQRHIARLCERYPHARIILAHIGRAYFLKNVVGQLDALRDYPNFYVDLAMLNHADVLEHAFSVLDASRILYGTDIPIALAPGKSVEINDQYTYVTPVPWALSISDEHRKLIFTSFLYESLRAIRKAAGRLELPRSWVDGVFYENGMKLLASIQASLDTE